MTSEEKTTLLLTYAHPTPQEIKDLEELLCTSPISWSDLQKLIATNAIHSMAYKRLNNYRHLVPNFLISELEQNHKKIINQNTVRLHAAKPILSALIDAGVDIIILKGNYFSQTLYNDPFYKKMNDVDILFQYKDLPKVLHVFYQQKLIPLGVLGKMEKYAQYSHHLPPFFTPDLACAFGSHWGLVNPLSGISVDIDSLWSSSVDYDFLDLPCKSLSWENHFFHLGIHLSYFKTGLKELADFINILKLKNLDFSVIKSQIHKSNSFDPCFHSYSLIQHLFPHPELKTLLQSITPFTKKFIREDTVKLCRKNFLLHSRTTLPSKIEKNFGLFSLTKDPLEKTYFLAKMWRLFLFPPTAEVKKITYLSPTDDNLLSLIGSYVFIPVRLSRVFAFDLGWKIYLLVSIGHHINLARSFFSAIFAFFKHGPKKYRAHIPNIRTAIAAMGFDLKKLQELESLE